MPTRRKVLTIFALIGIVGFTIDGLARLTSDVLHFYHLAWPWLDPVWLDPVWLDPVRTSALLVGMIGGAGVVCATPRPCWNWPSPTAREVVPLAVYLGALGIGIIWAQIAPSGPSVLVWSVARNSDLWWALVVWQLWCNADQRQIMIDRDQEEPNQIRHGVC
jgi:hypothetical protein